MKVLKLCQAKGDMRPFYEAFQKRLENGIIKSESTEEAVPESLKKIWELEDKKTRLEGFETPETQSEIPKQLKLAWQKEDRKAILAKDEESNKPEVLPKSLNKEELERHWKKEDSEARKYKEARGD